MSRRRKSRAKPPEEHKRRGPKPKNKVASEAKKASPISGAKRGRKSKSAEGDKTIQSLALTDAARALIYKKEGKPVPPKKTFSNSQVSAWGESGLKQVFRQPTVLAKKIQKSFSHEVIGGGDKRFLPDFGHVSKEGD